MSIFMFPVTSIQSASIDDDSGDGSGNVLKQNIIHLLHISHGMRFTKNVCATSKASDQPAHKRSLIRAFASHLNIL